MALGLGTVIYTFLFLGVLIGLPGITVYRHYELPIATTTLYDAQSAVPQLSEAKMLDIARELSETYGYRTVGTREHALADAWFYEQVQELAKNCPPTLQCEAWRQVGSGAHRFDMMGKIVWKTYWGLTNIILRVSNGTEAGKANAVLVNSHLDSTLPSPGAADDAIAAGVMLEIARVMTETPKWDPQNAIIFLWNGAEETLQDGSHLYSTQHETRHTVRAAMNLEAAGTKGPELLFQATSEEMIEAYAHATRPFGTVVANEIFSSGIILSDTDFRQFEEYLNVSGLDMAVVGHSYYYHTRKDIVANIQPGVAQHMADNSLAILNYLTSDESPLSRLTTDGYTKPSTTFFSLFGTHFFRYSSKIAIIISGTVGINANSMVSSTIGGKKMFHGACSVLIALLGALIGSNIVALLMDRILGHPLSWYSHEFSCILLYGPAALAGALTADFAFPMAKDEQSALAGLLVLQTGGALLLQAAFNIGSSAVLLVSGIGLFIAHVLDTLSRALWGQDPELQKVEAKARAIVAEQAAAAAAAAKGGKKGGKKAAMERRYGKEVGTLAAKAQEVPEEELAIATHKMPRLSYLVAQIVPVVFGTELLIGDLDVFVPLTGRMGPEAPAEHIIASIVALFGAYTFPMILPLARRMGNQVLRKVVIGAWALAALSTAAFVVRSPFDAEHPRRVFFVHMENITTNELSLHVGSADRAGGMAALVTDIAHDFAGAGIEPVPVVMDDWNTHWDSLYPFSQFIEPFEIPLDTPAGYTSSWRNKFGIKATNQFTDSTDGTRGLTIHIKHTGVIWTVLAFDADVVSWSLNAEPPKGMQRHHVKEASFYGMDEWTLELVVRGTEPIHVSFVGIIERGMWPGKKHEPEGLAMDLWAKLDPWVEAKTKDSVDALMLGCVGGAVVL